MATLITGVILNTSAIMAGVGQQSVPLACADAGLKDKDHWVQCSITNETQFDMVYVGEYFDSGEYYTSPPQKISPFSNREFAVSKKWGLAGVSGGNAWELKLDSSHTLPLSLGFTDPVVGACKSAALPYSSAESTYSAATDKGASGASIIYSGHNSAGEMVEFIITATSVTTGNYAVYTLRQIEVKW
ncbi:hypothetical protein BDQ12DRAFT_764903 [Crucibulum laeve]|uniref:Uncharacterized protein n=1 Tax=Crucibulum laeve TaxID=68775 RepID=A0A5C3M7T8_9AGAR|nr:hypothetical protein BDQ12DRAFT_764903 [Crucibulum laeve]